ncbi:hypothetical protein SAMN05518669_10257 [Variovorax sp. YR634]|uniref:bpX5 domain-containing protein n=1 Tax=Variovorax sp. YR634 TaxID=1884385 RepID=UPI00089588BF|nr:hypothetical protein [Variovorax sp. YR634]SDW66781.1 hypothetical protein SAMN05518669_10257 [Variovorax sp. YR634]
MSGGAVKPLEWRWRPRAEPLPAQAAVAWGAAARGLHERLLQLPQEQQVGLSAMAARDLLVVTGEADALPWVDGIAYAGPTPEAPGLWLPTVEAPDLPLDLIARSLQREHPKRQPLLLWPRPAFVLPLDRLLPLSVELLARIDTHWSGARA